MSIRVLIPSTSRQAFSNNEEPPTKTDELLTAPKRTYKQRSTPVESKDTFNAYQTALEMQKAEHKLKMERFSQQMEFDKEEHHQRMKVLKLKELYWAERLQNSRRE